MLSNFVPLPLVGHYDDPERRAAHHRVLYLRQGIWRKDRVHQRDAAGVSGAVSSGCSRISARMTDSQELDVLCYILVVSVGLSILFNRNASSGGLDIVAKIMNKYLHMELGKAMSLSGMCVALSAALVYDKKTVVLSILGTYFNGIVLDHFIFDNSIKRRVCIITEKEETLRQFILNDLHSGATMYEAIGAYNLEKHNEIITIVDKSEYQKLMNFINR